MKRQKILDVPEHLHHDSMIHNEGICIVSFSTVCFTCHILKMRLNNFTWINCKRTCVTCSATELYYLVANFSLTYKDSVDIMQKLNLLVTISISIKSAYVNHFKFKFLFNSSEVKSCQLRMRTHHLLDIIINKLIFCVHINYVFIILYQ